MSDTTLSGNQALGGGGGAGGQGTSMGGTGASGEVGLGGAIYLAAGDLTLSNHTALTGNQATECIRLIIAAKLMQLDAGDVRQSVERVADKPYRGCGVGVENYRNPLDLETV